MCSSDLLVGLHLLVELLLGHLAEVVVLLHGLLEHLLLVLPLLSQVLQHLRLVILPAVGGHTQTTRE